MAMGDRGGAIPLFLSGRVNGNLDYYRNNFISFAVRGVHMQMNVVWDFGTVIERYISFPVPRHEIAGRGSSRRCREFSHRDLCDYEHRSARERGAGRFADEDWLAYDQPWRRGY